MIYIPDFSIGITESFFQHIEKLTKQGTTPMLIKKRLIEISIELFQNVQRHSIDKKSSRLTIENYGDDYLVKSVNPIYEKDVQTLINRVKVINKLDQSELKNIYTKTLQGASLSEKGGAGLGLYKIALRSTLPLRYTFQKINNQVYTFSLEINLIS